MSAKRVSANRMALMKLKRELKTAVRGHRMLKDKRDGLMKHFLELVQESMALRKKVDSLLSSATNAMAMARAISGSECIDEALLMSAGAITFPVYASSVMSVEYPCFSVSLEKEASGQTNVFPYGLAETTGEMDLAVAQLKAALPTMIELAEREKQVQLLAGEIEKTRRRVNSLEHVMIPKLKTQIKDVSMKMDENERGNLTRLMKVKDMIVQQALEAKKARENSR